MLQTKEHKCWLLVFFHNVFAFVPPLLCKLLIFDSLGSSSSNIFVSDVLISCQVMEGNVLAEQVTV